ncbi:hypothetical protein KSS93_07715 [Pseudomonas xanthosomatis]|uniref:hypothetical protein n=1 Tax=Pseudomonas xanthosomatis TaxID=2842356 RepID=UPI001C3DCA8A|nr:hypothetical protein [Pseudomonas xanthosomatis]QXH47784.1 hypothetical protein KSS93_07715 [Pseudomonas xanthosomatis]
MKRLSRPQKAVALIAGFLLVLIAEAIRQTQLEPWIETISPSGKYRLENVKVGGPLFIASAKGYLRVVNINDPKEVYRSPLYDWESVDMGSREYEDGVGIRWLTFHKEKKDFDIAMPDWQESWQNLFISNTPYTVFPN